MKTTLFAALALTLLSALNPQLSIAFAQGTAFTYQGRLNSGGIPAGGLYDFRFRLDADPQGNTILATLLTNAIPVTNGLFTTAIDFGAGWFNGSNYWLEVAVRTNNPPNTLPYTALTPSQALTPTPYAVFANTAGNVSGTVSAAQINGAVASANLSGTYGNALTLNNAGNSFAGNGSGLTSLNAGNLTGTLPTASLPATVVTNTETGVTLAGTFSGNGGGLTNLNVSASQLAGGAKQNVFVGPAGNSTTSGANNTAVGNAALFHNQSGDYDTAIGTAALFYNADGTGNTASGFDALAGNTSGSYSTAVGVHALGSLGQDDADGGSNNIALGYDAGGVFQNNESYNIDIGNEGVSGENNTIRIGTPGIQTSTFIAGVITGNGGGLANLNVSASQLTGIGKK